MRIGKADDGYRCVDPTFGERLPLNAAGLLEPAEARRVEAHVAACHACADDQQAMRALLRTLESLEPDDLERAALEPGDPWPRRLSLLPSLGTILAAAGVVVALAVSVAWQRHRDVMVVSEVRSLRTELARLEQQNRRLLAAATGEGVDRQPVVPIAGLRFAGPPNF